MSWANPNVFPAFFLVGCSAQILTTVWLCLNKGPASKPF